MTPDQLVGQNVELVSLPEVCMRIQSMVDDPMSTANDFGKVVIQDTALSARLLKMVNSSYYGLPMPVDTVTRAVQIIGTQELRNLALAASAIEVFSGINSDLVDMVTFWRHSIFCGLVSRELAKKRHILHPERLFIAGLLHDVGRLLIYAKLPEQSAQILERLKKENTDICAEEKAMLGFDHADVGERLMKLWRMPPSLVEAVVNHHQPSKTAGNEIDTAIVYLANAVTHLIEQHEKDNPSPFYDPYGAFMNQDGSTIDINALADSKEAMGALMNLDLTIDDVGEVIKFASEGFGEVLNVFYPLDQMLE